MVPPPVEFTGKKVPVKTMLDARKLLQGGMLLSALCGLRCQVILLVVDKAEARAKAG